MNEIWAQLSDLGKQVETRKILDLLAQNAGRFEDFSIQADGLLFDYSKLNLSQDDRAQLLALAKAAGVEEKRDAMMGGAIINSPEERAVLHTALRSKSTAPLMVDGVDIRPEIASTLLGMQQFCENVRAGVITGARGEAFTDVVNIGIGGSDLGPVMACLALAPYQENLKCHFVSNVDPAHIGDVLGGLDPARTLVVIASKTFTTIETMSNAQMAVDWLKADLSDDYVQHLAAVSSAPDKTSAFGVLPDRVFGFGDYVGGRYSLWGPIGLPIMLMVEAKHFDEFLAGAASMDQHFADAPLLQNMPVMLGLAGVWHHSVLGYSTRAILPYEQRLNRFPAYLQQLDMESNGKSVQIDGAGVQGSTGPIVWGEAGTNGQHAFYQLIHQGTHIIPCEFLVGRKTSEADPNDMHQLLQANCLAQSEALMCGRSYEEAYAQLADLDLEDKRWDMLASHKQFSGNRPSTTLIYPQLTPYVLGQLIALYEHRVFVEGVIWGINSFDQWGVELGKELATSLLPLVKGADASKKDASTQGLLQALK